MMKVFKSKFRIGMKIISKYYSGIHVENCLINGLINGKYVIIDKVASLFTPARETYYSFRHK